MWARTAEVLGDRVTISGEVWLGPVRVGDCFTSAATAMEDVGVRLRVDEITAPPDAQEPGRVLRVVAVLSGAGAEHVRPDVVLLGDVEDP